MDAVQRWLTLVTLVSAALAGLLYLSRQIWRGFRLMERLTNVVQHELTPNTGSSMKDDVAAIAVALGGLQRDFRELVHTKDTAHEVLQAQIVTIVEELGLPGLSQPGSHKRKDTHESIRVHRPPDTPTPPGQDHPARGL